MQVPEVLVKGNHEEIRQVAAPLRAAKRRCAIVPICCAKAELSAEKIAKRAGARLSAEAGRT